MIHFQTNLGYIIISKGCGSKKCPFRNTILFSPAKGRVFGRLIYVFFEIPILPLSNHSCIEDTVIYVHGLGNWKHLSLSWLQILSFLQDLICLSFLQCSPDYLAMLCWFAPWYKEPTMNKKFLTRGVVKLIFPIKHCVLSATAVSFLQCFCWLEISDWKKGFKSFLTVCESCVKFVLILFTSFRDSKKISKRNGVTQC